MLQAQCGGAYRIAALGPDLGKALGVGPQRLGFVDQQLAARLLAVEADQSVLAIDEDHAVAQMIELLGRLLRCGAVTVKAEELEQLRMALVKRSSIAQGDTQCAAGAKKALHMRKAACGFEPEFVQILVVDEDLAVGERQQPFQCSLVIAPGGDQFAAHGG